MMLLPSSLRGGGLGRTATPTFFVTPFASAIIPASVFPGARRLSHPLEAIMTTEPSLSAHAADLETLKSEVKALKELVAKLQARMEQIEDEMAALRNMI